LDVGGYHLAEFPLSFAVWNFVGGVGFTISGAFGYSTAHWAQYESTLSTFWGGWAFLIGSILQLYEAVNPVSDRQDLYEKSTSG